MTTGAVRARGVLLFLAVLLSGVAPTQVGLPGGVLDKAYMVPLVLLAAITVAEVVVLRRAARPVSASDWLIVAWIAFAAAGALYSESPALTLRRVVPLVVLYVATMWSAWSYAEAVGESRLVDRILLAVAAVSLASWFLVPFRPAEMLSEGRLRGVVGVPNWLALVVALVFPLAVSRVLHRKAVVDYALMLLLVAVLFMTGTRGAALAAAVGCTYVLWRAGSAWRWVPIVAIGGLGLVLLNATNLKGTVLDVSYLRLGSVATGSGRFQPWLTMVDIIRQRPLLGYGFGTEELVLDQNGVLPYELSGLHIHDSFLGLAAQTGLLGMAAFFIPLFTVAVREICVTWNNTTAPLRIALLGCLLVGLVECVSESWIYSTGNPGALPFWLILMLLLRQVVSSGAVGARASAAGRRE